MITVLGIETSCDETSAAVLRDGTLLSNITVSQLAHIAHGGVVPELASRAHQQLIVPIVGEALQQAGVTPRDLSGVAAVYGPGLIGSLLVGLSFGKAYAAGLGIPFIGVNHMEAHLLSHFVDAPRPEYPLVNLTVSGGHTQLVLVRGAFDYTLLGETKDDAAGEAFDKVAKMLGAGYPGGPAIDRLAAEGNPRFVSFPRPSLDDDSFAFSFSGLKTSVLYYLRKVGYRPGESPQLMRDVAASFQAAVVDVLLAKLLRAAERFRVRDVAVAGGVSANSELRRRLQMEATIRHLRAHIPRFDLCTDNGAMVALVGYEHLRAGRTSPDDLTAVPDLQFATSHA